MTECLDVVAATADRIDTAQGPADLNPRPYAELGGQVDALTTRSAGSTHTPYPPPTEPAERAEPAEPAEDDGPLNLAPEPPAAPLHPTCPTHGTPAPAGTGCVRCAIERQAS